MSIERQHQSDPLAIRDAIARTLAVVGLAPGVALIHLLGSGHGHARSRNAAGDRTRPPGPG